MLRIKEVMNEQGVTGKQLAERMNVSPQYISGIVRGVDSASIKVLAEIAKNLNVPVSSLFDDYRGGTFTCPHCGKEITITIK